MKTKFSTEHSSTSAPFAATKPIEHIQRLIDHIRPYAEEFPRTRGEALRYMSNNIRVCYLLLEGGASLHRRGDGMVLNSEQAPFILGVGYQNSSQDHIYVRAMLDAKIVQVPLERFNLIVQKEELWESVCRMIVYTASRVYEHCILISQLSSYEIIKIHLLELMQEPERVRLSVTAANYIQNRTYLSRSGIMKIISNLRNAECITLNRGVLLSINHLPSKY
ncbi:helix-turn-helix domain-containing protein [Buttiauxella sp. WJP83]|uniref:helix-turn-helix domain-containing protein n=1 Tax=Buttiauxella sp. WJP83 TaxID=2986951 RepID=UPI0022DDE14E|nr:helix-turn-helix domain-containing protein [Buttiauxella sp. WJP83]WBM72575.1 helix-turn-helix domain-containing protein [Buttiauxella sp. WJP83]